MLSINQISKCSWKFYIKDISASQAKLFQLKTEIKILNC